jgi:hypothetical protein
MATYVTYNNLHFCRLYSYIEFGAKFAKHLATPQRISHIFLLDMSQPTPGNSENLIKLESDYTH